MTVINAQAPLVAEASARPGKYGPECDACGGRLPHVDAWRCPWMACRKWLRGLSELEAMA